MRATGCFRRDGPMTEKPLKIAQALLILADTLSRDGR
jgi:hypothetical protein